MSIISQTVALQYDSIFSPFKAAEFDNALAFLSKMGFTGVEIAVAKPDDVDADKLVKQLDASGLVCTTISTGQGYGLFNQCLSSLNKSERDGAVNAVKGHIRLSTKIGFPRVTIGLLRGKNEKGEKEALLDNLRNCVSLCAKYAESYGVTLQIEPIRKEETPLLNTVLETLDFIKSIGNPDNVGILYDTYHSYFEDGDMVKAVCDAGQKITNVHLCDSNRGLPGDGQIDFAPVIVALKKIGYKGPYVLETLSAPSAEYVNENCMKRVKSVLCMR